MSRCERLDQRRLGDRRRAEDRAVGSGLQSLVDVLAAAQPAADLHRNLDDGADPTHVVEVRGRSLARAVEVDDVQRPGPLLDPAQRRFDRIRVEDGLALVVALDEPHGVTVPDVDRGIEDQPTATEAQMRTKF